jgi:hypothetical protein
MNITLRPTIPIGFEFLDDALELQAAVFMDLPSLGLNFTKVQPSDAPLCARDSTTNLTSVFGTSLSFGMGVEAKAVLDVNKLGPLPQSNALAAIEALAGDSGAMNSSTSVGLFHKDVQRPTACVAGTLQTPMITTASAAPSSSTSTALTFAPNGTVGTPANPSATQTQTKKNAASGMFVIDAAILGLVVVAVVFVML